ncbi:transmembrane protein, putative [Bodo saltans]|uniref:Transmembrane protein, putative n=1 Tax=Bodo saltans TaxID=75058 RepID=A0A0S4IRY1_BODSA|nr:transmembrane protein, putative [Bodo saltans]|eukprot:CUF56245.1 transmembrane protein, putative [Bodo saltans]
MSQQVSPLPPSILCVFQLDVSASNENDNSGKLTSFVSASNNLLPIAAVMNALVSVFSNVHAVAIMWLERRIRMTNLTAISLTIAPPAFSTGTSSTPLSLRQSDDVQRTKASTFQDSHSDLRSRMSVARTLPTHVSGVTTVDGIGGDPPSFLSLQTMIRYICDQNNC